MKLSSLIKFDLLIFPIFLVFFYNIPIASGSILARKLCIRRSVVAHPAICTSASGDLYWHIRRSVLVDTQSDPSYLLNAYTRVFRP